MYNVEVEGERVLIRGDDGLSLASCFIARGHIMSLYVQPSQRRKGLASALVRFLQSKHPRLTLTCSPYGEERLSVEDTAAFYRKLGFKQEGDFSCYNRRMVWESSKEHVSDA